MVAVWGAVGLIASSLGGCGGSSAKKADGSGGGTGAKKADGGGGDSSAKKADGGTLTTACVDSVTKYCDRLQDCEPGSFAVDGYGSVADCVSDKIALCNGALTAPHTGETPALVEQCGDGIAAMSCTDFIQGKTVPACLPQGGTIAAGGSCSSDWQCASGGCDRDSYDACGTCGVAIAAGQSCVAAGPLTPVCPAGLLCAYLPGGTVPVCAPRVPLGAACVQTEVCPDNAICDPTTSVCTPLPALGQSCDRDMVFYCDPTQAAAWCYYDTCVPTVAAQSGQACGWIDGAYVRCSGGCLLTGDAGVGTCNPHPAEGAACTGDDFCVDGTTCLGGVCATLSCDGAPADAAVDAATTNIGAVEGRHAARPPGPAIAVGGRSWGRALRP